MKESYYYIAVLSCLATQNDIDKDEFGRKIRIKIMGDGIIVTRNVLDKVEIALKVLFMTHCIQETKDAGYKSSYSITDNGMKMLELLS